MSKIVLDAAALLALVNGEPGAQQVAAALGEGMISAVNFAEIVTKLALRRASIERTLGKLSRAELEVVDFDRRLAEATGADGCTRDSYATTRTFPWRSGLPCAGATRGCDRPHRGHCVGQT